MWHCRNMDLTINCVCPSSISKRLGYSKEIWCWILNLLIVFSVQLFKKSTFLQELRLTLHSAVSLAKLESSFLSDGSVYCYSSLTSIVKPTYKCNAKLPLQARIIFITIWNGGIYCGGGGGQSKCRKSNSFLVTILNVLMSHRVSHGGFLYPQLNQSKSFSNRDIAY